MCEQSYSESGALTSILGCKEFNLLTSDRDRLAGVVAGMEEQNARNLDALRRAEAENARLREAARWTEYDGTEATLPKDESGVILNWKGVVQNAYVERSGEWWDFGEDVDPLKIGMGDRWMPWPKGVA